MLCVTSGGGGGVLGIVHKLLCCPSSSLPLLLCFRLLRYATLKMNFNYANKSCNTQHTYYAIHALQHIHVRLHYKQKLKKLNSSVKKSTFLRALTKTTTTTKRQDSVSDMYVHVYRRTFGAARVRCFFFARRFSWFFEGVLK